MDFSNGAGFPFGVNGFPNGVPFGQQGKPIGNAVTRTLINLGVSLAVGLVWFYLELPALNLHSEDFYLFVLGLCAVYCVCAVITSGFQGEGIRGYFTFLR